MSMSIGATIASSVTLDDLASTANTDGGTAYETGPLQLVAAARAKGYNSVCMPLTTGKWRARWTGMCLLPPDADREDSAAEKLAEAWRSKPAFLREEVTMTRLEEAEDVTGLVSDWLELDAGDDWVRHDAEIALQQELAYASYLNVHTVILPAPRNRQHVASYARAVNASLKNTPVTLRLCIRLPIYDASDIRASPTSTTAAASPATPPRPRLVVSPEVESYMGDNDLNTTWEMWDVIRSICAYSTRLSIALDLTPPLPSVLGLLSKWKAEPVRFIFLPASTFIANTKGYPVLPKGTQSFIRDSMTAMDEQHRPTVILSDTQSKIHACGGEIAYSQYVRHLEKTSPVVKAAKQEGTVENFANGYQDYLQAPLQPLMDNLQSITYHTFEQDPVKYKSYEEAMYRALMDWLPSERIVFCVAGAGRGPLVARCLTAIKRSKRKAFIYAVEKNPNAYVTLQRRQELEWTSSKVELIYGDMRMVQLPEQVDILVSELLGSFGDNELSPECLDGAVRFLKPDGISIPSSYTAHLAPLSSSKLYNEAHASKDDRGVETPYVVMLQAIDILSGAGGGRCGPQVQECWEFEHPRRDAVLDERGLPLTNSHNARSAKLKFHIPHAGVMHGFGGYFEAVLYGSVGLSIHPHRKEHISKDMLSWFPIFFPLKDPLYLPGNSELEVSIWRLTNQRQVWYEWYAEAFLPVHVMAPPPPPSSSFFTPLPTSGSPPSSYFASPPNFNIPPPSPLADAEDAPHRRNKSSGSQTGSVLLAGFEQPVREPPMRAGSGLVKISQTQLHNPGGRSSWIGLLRMLSSYVVGSAISEGSEIWAVSDAGPSAALLTTTKSCRMENRPDVHQKSAICGGCNKLSRGDLRRCGGCRQTLYCSKECQKSHWKEHKPSCRVTVEGSAPKRSHPVLAIARKINMAEELADALDYVLIATLDLVNNPKTASTHSVWLMCTVAPTPGKLPSGDDQEMSLEVLYTFKDRGVNMHSAQVARGRTGEMLSRGYPKAVMDQSFWAHLVWTPVSHRANVNFDSRLITPRTIAAFKRLHTTASPVPAGIAPVNAATRYVNHLNNEMRLPTCAKSTTTIGSVSDYKNMEQRLRSELGPGQFPIVLQ